VNVGYIGRAVGSGYAQNRACSVYPRFIIKASASGFLYFSDGTPGNTTIEIQYIYNGGASWNSLGSVSSPISGKAVKYINEVFNLPPDTAIFFRAIGKNMGAVFVDMDITLVNSNA
jgi:hypothetical protein